MTLRAVPVSTSGFDVFLKCECFQNGGAFKFRGASILMFSIDDDQVAEGVETHSSSNHDASLSFAAKLWGIPTSGFKETVNLTYDSIIEQQITMKYAFYKQLALVYRFCKLGHFDKAKGILYDVIKHSFDSTMVIDNGFLNGNIGEENLSAGDKYEKVQVTSEMVLEKIWEKWKSKVHAKFVSEGNATERDSTVGEWLNLDREMVICSADAQSAAKGVQWFILSLQLCHCKIKGAKLFCKEAFDRLGELTQNSLSQVFTTLDLNSQHVRKAFESILFGMLKLCCNCLNDKIGEENWPPDEWIEKMNRDVNNLFDKWLSSETRLYSFHHAAIHDEGWGLPTLSETFYATHVSVEALFQLLDKKTDKLDRKPSLGSKDLDSKERTKLVSEHHDIFMGCTKLPDDFKVDDHRCAFHRIFIQPLIVFYLRYIDKQPSLGRYDDGHAKVSSTVLNEGECMFVTVVNACTALACKYRPIGIVEVPETWFLGAVNMHLETMIGKSNNVEKELHVNFLENHMKLDQKCLGYVLCNLGAPYNCIGSGSCLVQYISNLGFLENNTEWSPWRYENVNSTSQSYISRNGFLLMNLSKWLQLFSQIIIHNETTTTFLWVLAVNCDPLSE